MHQPRWPITVALVLVLAVVVAAMSWALARSSPTGPSAHSVAPNTIRDVSGVAVGVVHTRSGALAASDNYVAMTSETIVQNPSLYARLVREAYAPALQRTARRDGMTARESAPQSVELYAAGGKSVAVVAARRLDAYDGRRARTTSWMTGITWGPGRVAGHAWSLVETTLVWSADRWRVERLDLARRPAPAPRRLGYSSDEQLKTATFDRELRAMTAPAYGGG